MNANLPDDDEPLFDGHLRKASVPPPPSQPKGQGSVPTLQPRDKETPLPKEVLLSAEPADESLAWGHVGRRDYWGALSGDSGEEGVIRIVDAGTVYTRPQEDAGFRSWQRSPRSPQRFEMPWSVKPHDFHSLEQLGNDLGQNPPRSPNDPRLRELDQIVTDLLLVASRLHERGFHLGLIHPRNILSVPNGSKNELVLPDYGFAWISGPFEPEWIKKREDFRSLWDLDPKVQQHVDGSEGKDPPIDPVADIRILARVFACVLTGVPSREVPNRPPASSRHQTLNPAAVMRVWEILAQACRGDFKTIKDFAENLSSSPLSLHVFALPPPPPPAPVRKRETRRGPKKGLYVAVGAGVLAILFIVGILLWRPWRSGSDNGGSRPGEPGSQPPTSNGTGPNQKSSILALKAQYLAAKPEEQAAILLKMYQDGALSTDPDLRRQEEAMREELRRDFLTNNWLPRSQKAEEVAKKDLAQRDVFTDQVGSLHQELKLLHEKPSLDPTTDTEEKKWLDFSALRVRDLGSAH